MNFIAHYEFIFESNYLLKQLYYSLLPEVNIKISNKSKVSIIIENKNILLLNIESENIASLMATTNTWLRLIKVALDIQNIKINNF